MTLKPEEKLTLKQLADAAAEVKASCAEGCTEKSHASVVKLTTLSADVTGLVYAKLDDIYGKLSAIQEELAAAKSSGGITLGCALKRLVFHAPYALALILVGVMFWCAACGLSPACIFPWIKS